MKTMNPARRRAAKSAERKLESALCPAVATPLPTAVVRYLQALRPDVVHMVLEGMASGLPVVAFDAPGPKDIIHDGATGLLVREIGSTALAAALLRLSEDRALATAMCQAARDYAVACTWEAVNRVVCQA